MEFLAIIDVETANPDLSSICQIGIVSFDARSITATWQRLVNPEDYFDPWNMFIHGISEQAVAQAPTFPDIFSDLQKFLSQKIVVCHTSFDRVALSRATDKYRLPGIACTSLDSAKVARRAWPKFARDGYGLRTSPRHSGSYLSTMWRKRMLAELERSFCVRSPTPA